ncbi:DNA polymerase delta subunit 2 [Homalodisca vitripennis]|nr:DNA polymerase delta subunit 2 [Homalodisca vitripennis]
MVHTLGRVYLISSAGRANRARATYKGKRTVGPRRITVGTISAQEARYLGPPATRVQSNNDSQLGAMQDSDGHSAPMLLLFSTLLILETFITDIFRHSAVREASSNSLANLCAPDTTLCLYYFGGGRLRKPRPHRHSAQFIDVDVMPGEFDPTNHTLPQQPLHYCMFPKVSDILGTVFSHFKPQQPLHYCMFPKVSDILANYWRERDSSSVLSKGCQSVRSCLLLLRNLCLVVIACMTTLCAVMDVDQSEHSTPALTVSSDDKVEREMRDRNSESDLDSRSDSDDEEVIVNPV